MNRKFSNPWIFIGVHLNLWRWIWPDPGMALSLSNHFHSYQPVQRATTLYKFENEKIANEKFSRQNFRAEYSSWKWGILPQARRRQKPNGRNSSETMINDKRMIAAFRCIVR